MGYKNNNLLKKLISQYNGSVEDVKRELDSKGKKKMNFENKGKQQ